MSIKLQTIVGGNTCEIDGNKLSSDIKLKSKGLIKEKLATYPTSPVGTHLCKYNNEIYGICGRVSENQNKIYKYNKNDNTWSFVKNAEVQSNVFEFKGNFYYFKQNNFYSYNGSSSTQIGSLTSGYIIGILNDVLICFSYDDQYIYSYNEANKSFTKLIQFSYMENICFNIHENSLYIADMSNVYKYIKGTSATAMEGPFSSSGKMPYGIFHINGNLYVTARDASEPSWRTNYKYNKSLNKFEYLPSDSGVDTDFNFHDNEYLQYDEGSFYIMDSDLIRINQLYVND